MMMHDRVWRLLLKTDGSNDHMKVDSDKIQKQTQTTEL